jgi:hypothetical protein
MTFALDPAAGSCMSMVHHSEFESTSSWSLHHPEIKISDSQLQLPPFNSWMVW